MESLVDTPADEETGIDEEVDESQIDPDPDTSPTGPLSERLAQRTRDVVASVARVEATRARIDTLQSQQSTITADLERLSAQLSDEIAQAETNRSEAIAALQDIELS